MKSLFLSVLLLGFYVSIQAQNIKLINSGEVIEQSRVLEDSSRFEDAIKLLLTVPARDTNYVFMLSELAPLYNSNKQYGKALETAEEVLKEHSDYEVDMLRIKGVALFNLDKFESAVKFLEQEIAKRPFEYKLLYALGTIYYDHKDYEKAADYFFRILSFYPFHAGSHLNLGRIGILSGRKTHAMMALGMYLSINNGDNSRLVLLNNFLSNQVPEDGSVTLSSPNSCEKLDQIIRSKIALEESFKTKVQFKVAVVSQFEMFFNQLSTIKPSADDRWTKHYLPIYSAIKDQSLVEPFIYFLVKSSGKDDVKKWLNKNEKLLNSFYSNINDVMKKDRAIINTEGAYGFTGRVPGWYDDKNQFVGLGKKQNDKEEGRWVYLSETALIKAEGDYSQGKKTGIWKYYFPSGKIKSQENYETGEITLYNKDGSRNEHFYLKDDVTEGKVEVFYPSGSLYDLMTYKKGERDGKGESYYASGTKELTYEYIEGKPAGKWTNYSPTGQIIKVRNIKAGVLDGEYMEYYPSGKLKASGSYAQGEETGTWKYFHPNGKPEKSGEYKGGLSVGEWVFYNTQGEITSRGTLNEKGQWHGTKTNYYDGKPRSVYTYKDGITIKTVFYDWNGKETGNFGGSNGTFKAKLLFISGQVNGEGAYKNGDLHGKWTYYFPEGSKFSEYTYEEGSVVGTGTEYYHTGEKRYVLQYENDQLHGFFQEFYPTGSVKAEGWYQNGQREQQWITYYANGKIESDYYYLNGELYGKAYDHNTDGKVYMTTHFDEQSKVVGFERLDQNGNPNTKSRKENGKTYYESFFSNGSPKYRATVTNGEYSEAITYWLPDKSVYYSFGFSEGRRHGSYETYHPNGLLEAKGVYQNGSREGDFIVYYGNGVIDNKGTYVNGLRDSIWTFYFPSGNIHSIARYREDDRDGIVQYYSPEGSPIVEKFFESEHLLAYRIVNGNGQFGEWKLFTGNETILAKYPNGVVAYEEPFKKGLQNGVKRLNFSSGKPCAEYMMTNGDYNGSFKTYYPNGNLFEKKEYKFDELIGTAETYSQDGSLLFTETYLNGLLNGKTVIYKKGIKQHEFNFWAGLPD